MLNDLLFRLRALVRHRAVERELADELRFHLEHEIEKHVASGLTRADATRRARLDFGGVEQIKEECRDARGVTLIETVLQDLRYGVRMIRRSPLLSLTAATTMAFATAAVATAGSLADTLLWRALPVRDGRNVVSVAATRGRPGGDGVVSYPDYTVFRDGATTLTGLAAHYSTAPLFVAVAGQAREVNGAVVSANYFPLLGMKPALGRFFDVDEDRIPDRDRVAIIGYDFWQSTFAAAPAAVGSILTINGVAFTVIGVAPPQPVGLTPMPVELYIPTMMLRVGYRWCNDSLAIDCTTLAMIGRLAPGRSLEEAAAELSAIMPPRWTHAPIGENRGVSVRRPRGMSEDDQEPRLMATLGAVAIVLLLVCCANLSGLLGAQSAARTNEYAIRLSLGAAPRRIIRQVVTESLVLSCAGGAAGLLLSPLFIGTLAQMFFALDDEGHRLSYDFSASPTIAAATLTTTVIAGLLFSALPAVGAVRRTAARSASSRSVAARWSTGRGLLGLQAAVAVAMLATAALLGFSARAVLTGHNYETRHVALLRVRPRLVKYTPDQAQRFQRQVIQQLRAVPSVESVSMVGIGTILSGGSTSAALPGSDGQPVKVNYNEIGPAYFATLRTPLIAGREFDDRDTVSSPPVAVANETAAARFWPDGRWLGSTIVIGRTSRQIVGVVADVSIKSRNEPAEPWIFTPFWQNAAQVDSRIAIRTAGDPAALLPELAREVHRVDPDVPIAETITLPIRMASLTRPASVGALFIGYAATLAVLLTAIGLYGALAFAVSRRTREIGIRLALGAVPGQLVASIVREGMSVALPGALAGVALALAATRTVSHLLYASPEADWLAYTAAAAIVAAVGLAASLLPARRAAKIEPTVALRQE
jgi:predicted permease